MMKTIRSFYDAIASKETKEARRSFAALLNGDVAYLIVNSLKMIPREVTSILDVGCGDGIVMSAIQEQRPTILVVGGDISLKRLKENPCDLKIALSADRIPSPARQFDLVICLWVLEHLIDEHQYWQSISELVRVSRKYVLIGTPNNECIQSAYTKCNICGKSFNRYGHMRKLNFRILKKAFSQYGFIPAEKISFGEKRGIRTRPILFFQHRFGKTFSLGPSQCLFCGNQDIVLPGRNTMQKVIGYLTFKLHLFLERIVPPFLQSNEVIMILFRRTV